MTVSTTDAITVVSGLPRSGTSLMMQMLHTGGLTALTDGLRAADDDNPRGYYELEAVKATERDPAWIERQQPAGTEPRVPPYLILNAADMGSGTVFPFTQVWFDLLCSDLASFPIADAVAGGEKVSVAVPVPPRPGPMLQMLPAPSEV